MLTDYETKLIVTYLSNTAEKITHRDPEAANFDRMDIR